ncbi:hypothetical protein J6590_025518 [Homalodisca vitripennis]|nr:hypothetical protein J6590_025518 [Homalodisca vitripennis]
MKEDQRGIGVKCPDNIYTHENDHGVLLTSDLSQGAQIDYVVNLDSRLLGVCNQNHKRHIQQQNPQNFILLPGQANTEVLDSCMVTIPSEEFVRVVGVRQDPLLRDVPIEEMAVEMNLVSLDAQRRIQDACFCTRS